jgi:cystathionine beta-lyase
MSDPDDDLSKYAPETRLVRVGRDKSITGPFVNPPVVHASTVLFASVDEAASGRNRYSYGRRGTPTMEALEQAVTALEGAAGTVLCPSGLSAISTALLSCLASGDHLLMVDCVYGPGRRVTETVLARLGVTTTYFDPAIGAGIAELFTPRTKAVYLETPGSLTFEMQDVKAIAAVAKARGATVLLDNTWATPLFFRPLEHGVDLSIQAGTKYFSGHSDIMLGTVAANEASWKALKSTHGDLGLCVGPDDIYLGLRGIRTLAVRLERQMHSALAVAEWLGDRPEIERVLYPALAGDPGHALWKDLMSGACGLFGIVLKDFSPAQTKRFIDGLKLFGIGASWGGFESLVVHAHLKGLRTAVPWTGGERLVRLHIGLEDPNDLIADLEASLVAAAASA